MIWALFPSFLAARKFLLIGFEGFENICTFGIRKGSTLSFRAVGIFARVFTRVVRPKLGSRPKHQRRRVRAGSKVSSLL
jgi:hypothetical protein